MTDEQIIKALECCIAHENCEEVSCEFCPYERVLNCTGVMMQNAIDLINRQKAEIEELRSDKIIAERREKDARELFVDCTRQLEEAKAEIERLKRGVTFTFTIEDFKSIEETIISRLDNEIKSEAIKEFAERLKEGEVYMRIEFPNTKNGTEDYIVLSDDIDDLIKEMTEEKNNGC